MVRLAATFDDHIAILAAESPAAAILEWWRRLDQAAHEHFALVRGRRAKSHHELETYIAEYPGLGPKASAQVIALRLRRNVVAHRDIAFLSHDEAVSYARESFDVIGTLLAAWPPEPS